MSEKKVLFLMDCLYGDAGGGTERQFLELYRRLYKIDIDPYVVFLRDAPVHSCLSWIRQPLVLNVESVVSLSGARGVLTLLRYIKRNNIDVIHCIFDDATIVALIVKMISPLTKVISGQRNLGYGHSPIKKWLIGKTFSVSERVIVNAKAIADILVKEYGAQARKIVVIQNIHEPLEEIDKENRNTELEARRAKHEILAIVVANLRPVKGIDDLIEVASLTKDQEDICYVVVGDGGCLPKYSNTIKDKGLEDILYFAGYREDVRPYLSAADVAILSSHSEGLSNSLIEYMFAGLPIVATDVGGNREALGGGAFGELVPPKDPSTLAARLLQLVRDRERMQVLGRAAREHAAHTYNAERVMRDYSLLYRTV